MENLACQDINHILLMVLFLFLFSLCPSPSLLITHTSYSLLVDPEDFPNCFALEREMKENAAEEVVIFESAQAVPLFIVYC